jgi:HD-GYP domain-containing protein (c-di-GMP phosphodiesterase class II)
MTSVVTRSSDDRSPPTGGRPRDLLSGREVIETRLRQAERLEFRDWIALAAVGVPFILAAVALAGVPSDRSPTILQIALLVGLYGFCSQVEYEIGVGSIVPTALIFVPMLFILPLGAVPLAVLAGLAVGAVVNIARGKLRGERLVLSVMDAPYSIGPVVVLLIAGESAPTLEDVPVYILALMAQFVVEFASFAVRDAIGRGISLKAQVSATLQSAPVDAALAPIGLAVAFPAVINPVATVLTLPLVWLLGRAAAERRARVDSAHELSEAYRGTARLLGDVVEADDAYTGFHSRDVVSLTLAVGNELGLSQRDLYDAEFASLLHDVGKLQIPSELVNKPGPLDDSEWAVIRTHTLKGQKMLEKVGGILGEVGLIVRSCHERWDGTGYPDGLAGDAIPLVARVVFCCDAYSAITTARPYRDARSSEIAISELLAGSGTQFDPRIVEALAAVVAGGVTDRPSN